VKGNLIFENGGGISATTDRLENDFGEELLLDVAELKSTVDLNM
jgi:hypothetical protein